MSKSAKQFLDLFNKKYDDVVMASIPFGKGTIQTFKDYKKSIVEKEKAGVPAMCAEGLLQYESMENTINHLTTKQLDVYKLQKACDEILHYCVQNIRG